MLHDIQFELEYGPFTATRVPCEYAQEDAPKVGTVLYVLIEHYTQGNTFNEPTETCEVNSWHLTYDSAEARAKEAPKYTDYFGKHLRWRIEVTRVLAKVLP